MSHLGIIFLSNIYGNILLIEGFCLTFMISYTIPFYWYISMEGMMLKLKLQYLATSCEELTHWKRPWCWEGLGAGGEGDNRGWDGRMASLTRWTWVWVNSGSWWWTGRPGVLRFMGSQRVRLNWATELNWTDRAGSQPRGGKGKSKRVIPWLSACSGTSYFSCSFLANAPCITCPQTFCLKLHLNSQKLLRTCKEFHFMWAVINLHLTLEIIILIYLIINSLKNNNTKLIIC